MLAYISYYYFLKNICINILQTKLTRYAFSCIEIFDCTRNYVELHKPTRNYQPVQVASSSKKNRIFEKKIIGKPQIYRNDVHARDTAHNRERDHNKCSFLTYRG